MHCLHIKVNCLNQYELIRKYRCTDCGAIMMCSCDRDFGKKYLSHQLRQACVLETQERVAVTHGFIDHICPECRGEPPILAPKAPMHGRTTKFKRYYWREIFFQTVHHLENAGHVNPLELRGSQVWDSAEAAEVEKIKRIHERSPKYQYASNPPSEVIRKNQVPVVEISIPHVHCAGRKVRVESGGRHLTVEAYATQHYKRRGYAVLECESAPFHVLFALYSWPLIQDPHDPQTRVVSFERRSDFLNGSALIETLLPSDFGTPGYYLRREPIIDRHLNRLKGVDNLFEPWLEKSWALRQYLWADDPSAVDKARHIAAVLGDDRLRKVLRYLLLDYWKNHCGWPDLFVYQDSECRFVEVKSSKDKLSEDQMNWIQGNSAHMGFEFEILKLLRTKDA